MLALKENRGDTIIEVLFAFTVFSLLAVGASIIMNQGIAAAQKSLEITLVRQQIDAQAEALRYVRDAYFESLTGNQDPAVLAAAADWKEMTTFGGTGKLAVASTTFGVVAGGLCQSIPANAFILDTHDGVLTSKVPKTFDVANSPAYSQVVYNSGGPGVNEAYGIWVEAVKQPSVPPKNYIDFHIRACWSSPDSGPSATLGTIVRLYAPA
jgi:type II secretory pathway pseudopilin PulG